MQRRNEVKTIDSNDIERYLQLVGEELSAKGKVGQILLVGGAVMLLCIGNRDTTRDIDASFENNAQDIREAIMQVAINEGLSDDWLNDGAKGFLYSEPPVTLWRSYQGLEVYIPSLDYLLAMKIVAGRRRDIGDSKALIEHLGLQSPREVLDILEEYIPDQYLTAKTKYVVMDIFS